MKRYATNRRRRVPKPSRHALDTRNPSEGWDAATAGFGPRAGCFHACAEHGFRVALRQFFTALQPRRRPGGGYVRSRLGSQRGRLRLVASDLDGGVV